MNGVLVFIGVILIGTSALLTWEETRINDYQAQCAKQNGQLIQFARSTRFICAEVRVINDTYVETP